MDVTFKEVVAFFIGLGAIAAACTAIWVLFKRVNDLMYRSNSASKVWNGDDETPGIPERVDNLEERVDSLEEDE